MVYAGKIELEPQVVTWIDKGHDSFASREWVRSQVQWGFWEWQPNSNKFCINCTPYEGTRVIRVRLWCRCSKNFRGKISLVTVTHAHVL